MSRISRTAALLIVVVCLATCSCDRKSHPDSAVNKPIDDLRHSAETAPAASPRKSTGLHRVSGSPVTAILTIEPPRAKRGDQVELKLRLEIEPVWEIRELGDPSNTTATWLDLKLPDGVASSGDWIAPKSIRSISPDGHPAYVDEAEFNRQILVQRNVASGEIPITCHVHFQACNDGQCLEPTVVELATSLKVE